MRLLVLVLLLALAAPAAAQQGGSALEHAYDEVVVGTAGGRSRLADEYWERQKCLDEEVELARKRLDEALEQWNAVR